MAVTLKDVAKRAGVSIPTVSLIINGADMPFKATTRAAVLAAVESLNYRVDSMARRNANGSDRRDAVGLLLRSESASRLANSPVYEFICGINDVLMEQNQFLVMMKLHQLQAQVSSPTMADAPVAPRPPRVIAERFVDGLIVETGLPADLEMAVARYRIPTIWLNTNHHNSSDCIYPDEVHAGRLVTEHLIKLGHRNIAFLATPGHRKPDAPFSVVDRQLGYEQAMTDHKLVVRATRDNDPAEMKINQSLKAMFDRSSAEPVTGIVTYDLAQAVKLRSQLQQIGLSCPEDVSIVAAEDLHFLRRSWDITGVTCDRYQMGSQAAQMMLNKISNNGQPQPSQVFKGVFIPGSTDGPAPIFPVNRPESFRDRKRIQKSTPKRGSKPR